MTRSQAARVRKLVAEAGGRDRLIACVFAACPVARGRPRGASRYSEMDAVLLKAIRAAAVAAGAPMDELIRVNVQLIADPRLGASGHAIRQRLRKKAKALK